MASEYLTGSVRTPPPCLSGILFSPPCGGNSSKLLVFKSEILRYHSVTDLCFSLISESYIAIILQYLPPIVPPHQYQFIRVSPVTGPIWPYTPYTVEGFYTAQAFCPPFMALSLPPSLSTECDNTGPNPSLLSIPPLNERKDISTLQISLLSFRYASVRACAAYTYLISCTYGRYVGVGWAQRVCL